MPHIAPPNDNGSEFMFRLLVRSTALAPSNARTIEFSGIRWTLTDYMRMPTDAEAPDYTCISYSWGSGRTVNPFEPEQSISDRAIPAIESTIRALQPAAIWIDSLCVPSEDLARAACLQRMGTIFGTATRVAAVLSKSCAAILEQIHGTGRMDPAALTVFESDNWVTRAWTYQEIANSKAIYFITEGGSGIAVEGQQLLNSIGHAISDHKKSEGIEPFESRSRYPRVDALEDLLADYMIAGYLQRFAYQVMAAMDRRYSERPEDLFNAMIGAITSTAADGTYDPQLPPAERFMRACESKGDYSFIYCAAPRSATSGRRWRPVAGPIPALLSWHTYGDGQSGSPYSNHLQLNNMCRMNPGAANSDARQLATSWAQGGGILAPADNLAGAVLERLRRIGFSGSGEHLEMEGGYFFPQSALASPGEFDVVVAAGVRWVHGGPGLLLTRYGASIRQFRDVGVFVGRVPQTGDSISVA
jgi:hypothetical protein